jgi:CRP-like cAMP-binding protein
VRLASFLRRVEPFRDAPGPAMGWLVGRLGRERHGAGDVIVREGEVGDRFYVVERGGVAVAVGGQPLAMLGEGDFFGEVALVQEVPRTATVTATGDVELLTLTRADFRAFLAAHLPGAVLLEETADRRRVEAAG